MKLEKTELPTFKSTYIQTASPPALLNVNEEIRLCAGSLTGSPENDKRVTFM